MEIPQPEIVDAIEEAVKKALSTDSRRYIDVSRVPLICQSIVQIHTDIKDIKDNMVTKESFSPVRNFVYGLIALISISVGGAILTLVINR